MAGVCCGVNMAETETASPVEPAAFRRNFDFLPADSTVAPPKRKTDSSIPTASKKIKSGAIQAEAGSTASELKPVDLSACVTSEFPNSGLTTICGRRRDMEDAVAVHPFLCGRNLDFPAGLHFYGVYDGHGCSHVATKCKQRMHEIVKDEIENGGSSWEQTMFKSFLKMDKEAGAYSAAGGNSSCRCELRQPQCDAVGSTAVVAVISPEEIVVSNCGDSRAILCRNGVAIPLSVDHKPDRPDELNRIEQTGGRVIFWDCARVLGVLAMSRAIGDDYLKPYVIPEPEVTITDRAAGDECLILASDGLWDVVSNETACRVARSCLQYRAGESSEKACSDASILLTKLAMARCTSDNVSVVVVDLRRT